VLIQGELERLETYIAHGMGATGSNVFHFFYYFFVFFDVEG